ncbi:MAG: hypothetical protein HKN43_07310 [Rhodothermales bacterium]|nr:hypothetical protein [Rhodothermales bacterium]
MVSSQHVLVISLALGLLAFFAAAPYNGSRLANAYPDVSVHYTPDLISGAVADTLFMEIMGGETLIFSLPDSLSNEAVDTWKVVRSPALSRLAGRSFVWKTRKADKGQHSLTFEGTSQIIVDEFSVARIETWTVTISVN